MKPTNTRYKLGDVVLVPSPVIESQKGIVHDFMVSPKTKRVFYLLGIEQKFPDDESKTMFKWYPEEELKFLMDLIFSS